MRSHWDLIMSDRSFIMVSMCAILVSRSVMRLSASFWLMLVSSGNVAQWELVVPAALWQECAFQTVTYFAGQ